MIIEIIIEIIISIIIATTVVDLVFRYLCYRYMEHILCCLAESNCIFQSLVIAIIDRYGMVAINTGETSFSICVCRRRFCPSTLFRLFFPNLSQITVIMGDGDDIGINCLRIKRSFTDQEFYYQFEQEDKIYDLELCDDRLISKIFEIIDK